MRDQLDTWLGSLRRRTPKPASEATIRAYRHKVDQFLDWLGEREPTADVLYEYRIHRQNGGRRPRTIRVDLTAIFTFFEWLERYGHASGLPRSRDVQRPAMDDAQRERPTDAQVEALFNAADKMPAHTDRKRYLRGRALCILAVLAGAGLRRAELLALDTRDIRREAERWYIQVRVGKGAQPRMVPIGNDAKEVLDEWLAFRGRWCKQHGHTSDALIPLDSTRRLCERGLITIWQELCELAGIRQHITPHGLRHWYGTRTAGAEDLPTAQKMLGHKRLETTFQYLGTDDGKKGRAADSITFRARTTENGQSNGSHPSGAPQEPPVRKPTRRPMRRDDYQGGRRTG